MPNLNPTCKLQNTITIWRNFSFANFTNIDIFSSKVTTRIYPCQVVAIFIGSSNSVGQVLNLTVSDDGHIFWQINWTKRAKVCSEQFLDFCFCCCFKEVSSQVVFQFDFIELVVSYKQSHYRLFICDVDQGLDGLLLRNF